MAQPSPSHLHSHTHTTHTNTNKTVLQQQHSHSQPQQGWNRHSLKHPINTLYHNTNNNANYNHNNPSHDTIDSIHSTHLTAHTSNTSEDFTIVPLPQRTSKSTSHRSNRTKQTETHNNELNIDTNDAQQAHYNQTMKTLYQKTYKSVGFKAGLYGYFEYIMHKEIAPQQKQNAEELPPSLLFTGLLKQFKGDRPAAFTRCVELIHQNHINSNFNEAWLDF